MTTCALEQRTEPLEGTPTPDSGTTTRLTQRAYLNALAALLDYAAKLGVGFLITPVLVGALGRSLFGVWEMLGRLIGYLSAADGRPTEALKLIIAKRQATAGPQAMGAVYGRAFHADRAALALLGLGVGCYLGAATFSQALLALDRGRQAALAWTGSAICFLALYFATPGSELMRIALSFAIATALCCALVVASLVGRMRRR